MALLYRVAGRSVATAATADNFGAALWNPHATKDITLRELHWFKTVATADNLGLARITTRGTQTLTVTPDIDNDDNVLLAPISGAVLDLTYSAQPTIATPYKQRIPLPAAIGAGMIWVYDRGLRIPAGTGLGIATPVATILQPGDITVVWEE